jgi:hypothetical protein
MVKGMMELAVLLVALLGLALAFAGQVRLGFVLLLASVFGSLFLLSGPSDADRKPVVTACEESVADVHRDAWTRGVNDAIDWVINIEQRGYPVPLIYPGPEDKR